MVQDAKLRDRIQKPLVDTPKLWFYLVWGTWLYPKPETLNPSSRGVGDLVLHLSGTLGLKGNATPTYSMPILLI